MPHAIVILILGICLGLIVKRSARYKYDLKYHKTWSIGEPVILSDNSKATFEGIVEDPVHCSYKILVHINNEFKLISPSKIKQRGNT
jgi:hypothetical protein